MIDFEGYLFAKGQISAITPVRRTPGAAGDVHHIGVYLIGMNEAIQFRFNNSADATAARDRLHGLVNNSGG